MDKTNPYLILIESCLSKLSLKYDSTFKYEVKKIDPLYTFTIYQEKEPIFHKEISSLGNSEMADNIHFEIVNEFFISGIERIFMQKENEKKLFPRDHSKLKEKLNLTKGKW